MTNPLQKKVMNTLDPVLSEKWQRRPVFTTRLAAGYGARKHCAQSQSGLQRA